MADRERFSVFRVVTESKSLATPVQCSQEANHKMALHLVTDLKFMETYPEIHSGALYGVNK
jgi:hypothetical protein